MSDKEPNEIVDAITGRRTAMMTARLMTEAIRINRQKIVFPVEVDPVVTIVIVSHNASDLLCMTLLNLSRHHVSLNSRFEVVVVDNNSGVDTIDILKRLENVKVIFNEKNDGFGPACNKGARFGKGRFILFLNPDMDLLPGAIDAMVEGFNIYDQVGIVGARLIFPGGILQEAGAYFIDDAQVTHPYLRGCTNPSLPEAMFAREVGYVSGAALMIPRDLFESLDGFDNAFAPAYFEDTDLCLRCAQLGRRVVYQPRAIAFHYENATSPTRDRVEKLLAKNKAILLERHRNWLFETGVAPTGFMVREPDRNRFRVLFVDDHVPHVDSGAGLPRANSIINLMTKIGYLVTVLPVYSSDPDPAARYRDIDQRVEILEAAISGGLQHVIRERSDYYDLIWVSRPHNVDLVMKTFLECGVSLRGWVKSRIIFDTEALFSAREAIANLNNGRQIDGASLSGAVLKETSFSNVADIVVSVSEGERKLLKELGGVTNARVLGHLMEVNPGAAPFEARNGVLFVGPLMEYGTPNVDSIDWFIEKAWPGIAERLGPGARLILVGSTTDEIRRRFERPNVVAMGRLDTLEDIFNSVRVSIAPTRFAAGIPQKVHNCVAHGVPMVVSPLLRAQLGWEQGVGCLSAAWQRPNEFVEAVVRLHEEKALWQDVRRSGLEQIERECSLSGFRVALRNICEEKLFI